MISFLVLSGVFALAFGGTIVHLESVNDKNAKSDQQFSQFTSSMQSVFAPDAAEMTKKLLEQIEADTTESGNNGEGNPPEEGEQPPEENSQQQEGEGEAQDDNENGNPNDNNEEDRRKTEGERVAQLLDDEKFFDNNAIKNDGEALIGNNRIVLKKTDTNNTVEMSAIAIVDSKEFAPDKGNENVLANIETIMVSDINNQGEKQNFENIINNLREIFFTTNPILSYQVFKDKTGLDVLILRNYDSDDQTGEVRMLEGVGAGYDTNDFVNFCQENAYMVILASLAPAQLSSDVNYELVSFKNGNNLLEAPLDNDSEILEVSPDGNAGGDGN